MAFVDVKTLEAEISKVFKMGGSTDCVLIFNGVSIKVLASAVNLFNLKNSSLRATVRLDPLPGMPGGIGLSIFVIGSAAHRRWLNYLVGV